MKAVGYKNPLPIGDPESLMDITLPEPEATGHDLLVEIKAVSVNPVDTKLRGRAGAPEGAEYKVLGFDAAGIVRAVGSDVTLFKPGDDVFYAGSWMRPGTNSELHLVDERIVGAKPKSLSFARAAALPLTSITAWELLFDRFGIVPGKPANAGALLVIGGAGGVGSILTQLARRLTGLTIIATASNPASEAWCLKMGAHHTIDPAKPFPEQMAAIGCPEVGYIAGLTATTVHYPALIQVLAPQGKFGLIDDPESLDANLLKRKCASLHWEFMFARSMYGTPDMIGQHRLLNEVAALADEGMLQTTVSETLGKIDAATLKKAHAMIETGRTRGKLVLEGFS